MPVTKQKYNVNSIRQLIDLNGEATNFEIEFKASCADSSKEFEILVIDQTTLDSEGSPEYKKVKNSLSGRIVSDKNVYQNYFLVLRSEQPCEVEVELNFNKLQDHIPQKPQPQPQQSVNSSTDNTSDGTSLDWKKIVIIVGVVAVIGLVIWYYSAKSNEDSEDFNLDPSTVISGVMASSSTRSPPSSPKQVSIPPASVSHHVSQSPHTEISLPTASTKSIADRLRNLQIKNSM